MKYTLLSNINLVLLALLIAILSAVLVSINSWTMFYYQLPVVHFDKTNTCVKVDNYQNGHAFNCNDVDVLLRQYRKHTQ